MNIRKTARSATRKRRPGLAVAFVSLLFLALSPALSAAESAGDCTQIDLSWEELDGSLTDREITELRQRRHAIALNAFERCAAQQSGAAIGQGGGQGSGQGSSNGNGVAATGIAGTDSVPVETEAPQRTSETAAAEAVDTQSSEQASEQASEKANGRAPLDIPAADNDSVLAAQIRRAAETETDPDRKAKLWNEYRKIKGLPVKDS